MIDSTKHYLSTCKDKCLRPQIQNFRNFAVLLWKEHKQNIGLPAISWQFNRGV